MEARLLEEERISSLGTLTWCFCFKELRDRQTALIITVAALYYLSTALTSIPLKLLINKRIAGDAEDPNARSAFIDASVSFVHAFMCFIFGRYTSGLGDYLGRKPILITSTISFILTRFIYLNSQSAEGFIFGALIGGTFDCVYFTCLAWVCDLFPEGTRRSKRVGLFTGVVGGLAFVVGVPAGALIAKRGYELPLKLAMCGAFICLILLVFLPVDDTLGIKDSSASVTPTGGSVSPRTTCCGTKRQLPGSWKAYLWANFPINSHAYELILKAKYPLDWLTNFLMHTTSGLLNLILIQYCLAVYNWSAVLASAAVLSVGICLGLFAPIFLHRFSPVPLAFYAMIIFTVGHVLLSISGTGMSIAPLIGVLGIICFAMGTSWVPALQTNLLSQYSADVQGAVSGTLSQQNDSSLLPAYIMSLGFTLTLGRDAGGVYWPGSAFAMTSVMGICSIFCHYKSHGSEVFHMSRRKPVPIHTSPSEEDLAKDVEDDITVEDTVVPPILQQP